MQIADPLERLNQRQFTIVNGGWLPPLNQCIRAEIPMASYLFTDALLIHELEQELSRMEGSPVEIVYDRATTKDASMPGHHVYRRDGYGNDNAHDRLTLMFSIKRDMDKPYTPDNAIAPDRRILKILEKMKHDQRSGNDPMQRVKEHNEKMQRDNDAELSDMGAHFDKEVDAYVTRGKNDLARKIARKRKRKKSKKASSFAGQKKKG